MLCSQRIQVALIDIFEGDESVLVSLRFEFKTATGSRARGPAGSPLEFRNNGNLLRHTVRLSILVSRLDLNKP